MAAILYLQVEKYIIKLIRAHILLFFLFIQNISLAKGLSLDLGIDVPKLIYALENEKKYEGELGIDVNNKLYALVQIGQSIQMKIFEEKNYTHYTEGYYVRFGGYYTFLESHYTFLEPIKNNIRLGTGFFICRSIFNDWAKYLIKGDFWGDYESISNKRDWKAYSVDIPLIVKVDIGKFFYGKITLSNRFLITSLYTKNDFQIVHIPGFGRNHDYRYSPAMTVTLGFRIRLSKKSLQYDY